MEQGESGQFTKKRSLRFNESDATPSRRAIDRAASALQRRAVHSIPGARNLAFKAPAASAGGAGSRK